MERPEFIRHWTELEGPDDSHYKNNTDQEVRLLVVGEASKAENRIRYPMNEAHEATRPDRWVDWPARPMGLHDGKPSGSKA